MANSFTQDERGREGSLTTRDPSLDALLDVKQKIEDLDEGTCFDLSQESGSTGSECSDPQFRIGIAGDQYDWHDRRSLPYLLRGRDAVQTFKRDVRHDDGRVQVGRKRDQPTMSKSFARSSPRGLAIIEWSSARSSVGLLPLSSRTGDVLGTGFHLIDNTSSLLCNSSAAWTDDLAHSTPHRQFSARHKPRSIR